MLARHYIATQPDRCRDCQVCTLACSLVHEGACGPGYARLRVHKHLPTYTFDIRICRQCRTPECLAACPAGAMSLDARGVVLLDEAACVRCGACADVCPYGAIFYNGLLDRYLKCDLCAGLEAPLCATLCPVGALVVCEEES